MGLAGNSKNYQPEKDGRFAKQLGLPRSRLMQSGDDAIEPDPGLKPFRETYRQASAVVSEPQPVRGKEPAVASAEREVEAPKIEDTRPIAAVKEKKAGRPQKITGRPWDVEGVSRRTWERRQARAKRAGQ